MISGTPSLAKNGMVVSSQPIASLVGAKTLMDGGNAIDAAVATAAVLGVMTPTSLGLGSDAFALVYAAREKKLKGLDGSGCSPRAASAEFYRRQGLSQMPATGIHSVTLPGVLRAWSTLIESYGTLPLGRLLAPAIEYAERGFPVTAVVSREWSGAKGKLAATEEGSRDYLISGRAPGAGDIFYQPNLARTLRLIAEGGADVFYEGEFAEKFLRTSKRLGGLFEAQDLAEYRCEWVEPVISRYRGFEVAELPPATQGFVALEMLALLEGYDLKSIRHNSAEYLHLLIEAKKLAFADRDRYLADRRFMKVSVQDLLAPARIERLKKEIRMDRASAELHQEPAHSGTEYVAVVDAGGNAVSYIESLFMSFGSGVVVEDTGVILQNRGHLFSLDPEHPNCIGPQKRCMHTLMPGMVLKDGRPYCVLGLKGGHVQPQVQVQSICALLDCGLSVQEAIGAPRFNHLNGLEVGLEPGFAQEVLTQLAGKGHKIVTAAPESYGGAHAILVDHERGTLMGGSDPRKDGAAVGF